MAGFFTRLSKVFGSKSDRDIKRLYPIVDKINEHYEAYNSLSDDQIRGKTVEFKSRIDEYLTNITTEINNFKSEIDKLNASELDKKEEFLNKIEDLDKQWLTELEKILWDLLPEAFAVIKQTAYRLSTNKKLEVTASENDKLLSASKPNVQINGSRATYLNEWTAAGAEIVWNMIHYDVQLIGGIVLHEGKIAEMATGEGKTLVSTLPAYLNALSGRGVHIVTVNDYLAKRDSEWNAPIFEFHGLQVSCIDNSRPHSPERIEAYKSDIIYGTNNEFGFDYLRDNMAQNIGDIVQRSHHFAMIDEVDSVLIDDARTPLIISGPVPKGDVHEFDMLKPRIQSLVDIQRKYINKTLNEAKKLIAEGKNDEKTGGLALLRCHRGLPKNKALIKYLGEQGIRTNLTKVESYFLQDQQKQMPKVDEELYFVIDEKNNNIELTDKGIDFITQQGEDNSFFVMPDIATILAMLDATDESSEDKSKAKEAAIEDFTVKSGRIHSINQLLKAYTLFEKDVEYIIQDNSIKLVDEQTGRVMEGRRYSDGLHQAIEAKESVEVQDATQTYATITLQNFFRMYHKLSGMTGTAETEAHELWEIYKLDVVVIPTNKPIIRKDENDLIYKSKREKYNAVIDHIEALTKEERPVLVGTTNVEISELLSRMLKMRRVKHNVLNAKQHQREADIVKEAGQAGMVTIATNMAGRGTDIKISEGVKAAGGLAIIGTERHESRRVDRQLRGRAGRQGDPGSSRFYVSMEDDLMRLFNSERIVKLMDRLGHKDGDVMEAKMLNSSIENNQKKVEQNNFGSRKRVLEYDDVMNKQRTVIYTKRRNSLYGEKLSIDIRNILFDWIDLMVANAKELNDYESFKFELLKVLGLDYKKTSEEFEFMAVNDLVDDVFSEAQEKYSQKNKNLVELVFPVLTRMYKEDGSRIENVLFTFTDGILSSDIPVNLKKALDSDGKEVITSFERSVVLSFVDDLWKDHLKDLDELKTASYNASIEQKDPLLVYKLESFKLFEAMMNHMNGKVLTMLYKGHLEGHDENNITEAREVRKQEPKLKTGREEVGAEKRNLNAAGGGESKRQAPQQVVNQVKVGRNDPCPCGSGKKYKNCHG